MRGNDDLDRVHQTEKFRSHILGMLAGNAPLSRVLESIVSGVEQLSPNALSSILLPKHATMFREYWRQHSSSRTYRLLEIAAPQPAQQTSLPAPQ